MGNGTAASDLQQRGKIQTYPLERQLVSFSSSIKMWFSSGQAAADPKSKHLQLLKLHHEARAAHLGVHGERLLLRVAEREGLLHEQHRTEWQGGDVLQVQRFVLSS